MTHTLARARNGASAIMLAAAAALVTVMPAHAAGSSMP